MKSSTRQESSSRAVSAGKNHRRTNSTQAPNPQRSFSNERTSNKINKTQNLLNNSSMIDETLNYSKDLSYYKENYQDLSHISGIYGHIHGSNILKHEDLSMDYGNIMSPDAEASFKQKANKNTFFEKGKALFKEKHYQSALRLLKEAINYDSTHVEANYLLGVCYLWMGQHENAIHQLTNLLEKQAFYHKNVYILLSIAQKKCGDIAGAIKTVPFQ